MKRFLLLSTAIAVLMSCNRQPKPVTVEQENICQCFKDSDGEHAPKGCKVVITDTDLHLCLKADDPSTNPGPVSQDFTPHQKTVVVPEKDGSVTYHFALGDLKPGESGSVQIPLTVEK